MLLVFSDDWGRHPSSCQHLVKRLLPRQDVVWVNTIGMRPPRLDYVTIRRGAEKLTDWCVRGKTEESAAPFNPRVLRPLMWPWFRRRHDRWLNERLLERALRPTLASAAEPVHAITTVPISADLIGRLSVSRWIYYCVDDFSAWPGLDQPTMLRMERDLVRNCDDILAVSEPLVERVRALGRSATLLTHGVDLDFWQDSQACELPETLQHIDRPLVVFWGVVDQRMDVAWVEHLARRLEGGTIALIGPLDNPDNRLLKIPGVVCPGPLSMAQLPGLAHQAAVLIMPYADLPVTRAMQPLKLKEYMATGRAVVVSNLPSTTAWSDCVDVAASPGEFADLVLQRISSGALASQQAARERLQAESWEGKARQLEQYLRTAPLPAKPAEVASRAGAPVSP